MPSLSVVIPCYNEENNLHRGVLSQVNHYLSQQKYTWEVLICNDESTDNSLKICQKFAAAHPKFKVLSLPHGGKPAAVWTGIQHAKSPLVLFTDMDQSTPISELAKLLPFFKQDFDIVIGSRGVLREGNSFLRQIGGPVFLFLRRLVLLRHILDTQCGFKIFKSDVARRLFPHLQFFQDKSSHAGWRVSAFDVELLFLAEKLGYHIKEVPVAWHNQDTSDTKGDSSARFQKESLQMLQEIYRVKSNDLRHLYDHI